MLVFKRILSILILSSIPPVAGPLIQHCIISKPITHYSIIPIVSEALALQEAGAFAIIFEAVPAKLSAYVTQKLQIPTISIGGGPGCSGQLLVTPDVLGMFDAFTPSFAKKYQNFNQLMQEAFTQYAHEVRTGVFPGEEHSYKISDDVLQAIEDEFGKL
jgi:3-methyl-2-oxobutanoate hydroxymethyltransferase